MEPRDQPRTLPHSEESERACLAAALLDPAALRTLADLLTPEDLYVERNRLVWTAVLDLHHADRPVDLRTVQARLEDWGKLDVAGGVAYLSGLDLDLPDLGRVEHYAEIVRERATRRRLIEIAQETLRDALDGGADDAGHLAADLEARARTLGQATATSGPTRVGEIADTALERLEDGDLGHLQGIPTGLPDLDRLTHGLGAGRLIVLAGRPGTGKSTLALNILQHVALREERPAALWSLEMSADEIAYRVLCSEADVPFGRLRTGHLSRLQWERLVQMARRLRSAPLRIDDTPHAGVREITAQARSLRDRGQLDVLAVDYLQLMQEPATGGGWRGNRNLELSAITRSFKLLAKELEIPILLLSQLSRDPERRGGDHRPRLSDLRDSGAIEQDSDLVIFVHREELYKPDDPELQGIAELIVAKHRNGPTGVCDVAFLGDTTTFRPLDRNHQPPDPAIDQDPIPWEPPQAAASDHGEKAAVAPSEEDPF